MSWPTPQDYHEAVQNPRHNFDDPELQTGVITVTPLGLPLVASGSFASVYSIQCGAKRFAVRCFLKDIPDQQERYVRISEFVMNDNLPYTVDFNYLKKGILTKGAWYPVLKMDWIEGVTLDNYIRQQLSSPDGLADATQKFKAMISEVQAAGIAHGDLQHGNIMVTTSSELRLVDYDGMYVAALQGRQSTEIGHRNYQHPARAATHFGPYVDNFAAWSIYTSLLCLSIDPSLSEKVDGCDECLLFRQADYRYPLGSPAFALLEQHADERVRTAAKTLRGLLSLPVERVPFLSEQAGPPADLPPLEPTMIPALIAARNTALRYAGSTGGFTGAGTQTEAEAETGHYWPSLNEYIRAMSKPQNFLDPSMHSYVLTLEHGLIHAEGTDHGALFRFRRNGGRDVMVKAFLKGDELIQHRYQSLHKYLRGTCPNYVELSKYFVEFDFIAGGIKVNQKYRSIVRMDFRMSPTLFEAVETRRWDHSQMRRLIKHFVKLASVLQENGVVHGDIDCENILVASEQLVLVDYDLTTIPLSRPLASQMLGNKHFQHPRRKKGGPDLTDDFSCWIVYYSLQILMLYPALWNMAGSKPGRLLFHADDLKRPNQSELFHMLRCHFNVKVREIGKTVEDLCLINPADVPVFKPQGEPLGQLVGAAIASNVSTLQKPIRLPAFLSHPVFQRSMVFILSMAVVLLSMAVVLPQAIYPAVFIMVCAVLVNLYFYFRKKNP